MKTIIQFGSCLVLLTLLSCDVTSTESISPIIATDLPVTCSAGETIAFKVYHIAFNGCGKYSKHETARQGDVITVRFFVEYPKAQICPDNIPTLETFFYFEAKEKGDLYFRFFQDNYDGKEYILDTLRVQ